MNVEAAVQLQFNAGQRWLVVAPHPDDELFSAGGVLQAADQAGAQIRVLLLTDGDNNPWPQRWLERRWRIDAAARSRWAARRRAESQAALRALGLDPDRVLLALGWPDSEVGARLVDAPTECVAQVAGPLRDFAPTHVILPSADDRHPDHNAAAVLLTLALERIQSQAELLAYRVHGRRGREPISFTISPRQLERKALALREYVSQLTLSRRRMQRLAIGADSFHPDPFDSLPPRRLEALAESREGGVTLLRVRGFAPGWTAARGWQLLLVLERRNGGLAGLRFAIDAGPGSARFNRRSGELELLLALDGVVTGFVKIESSRRRLWIYDRHGWCRFTRFCAGGHPALVASEQEAVASGSAASSAGTELESHAAVVPSPGV